MKDSLKSSGGVSALQGFSDRTIRRWSRIGWLDHKPDSPSGSRASL